jgi:hypothetical protein
MDSVSTVFSWVMNTDTSTLGNMTEVMIVQNTIPVTFMVRAVLGAVRWEKRKGGKDEPLPEEDIAGR